MSSYWDFLPTRLLTRNTFPEALDLLQSKAMVRPIAAEPAAAHAPTMQACGAPCRHKRAPAKKGSVQRLVLG